MTIARIKKYKNVNILILNEWQKFIYIIFYKGQFYANTFEIKKVGDYTGTEYLRAMDATLLAAKQTADLIIKQRSLMNRIKNYGTITLQKIKIKWFNEKRPETEPLQR